MQEFNIWQVCASASATGTGAGAGAGMGDAATKKFEPTRSESQEAAEQLMEDEYAPAKAARTAVKMTRVNCIVTEVWRVYAALCRG
jgi:hypothetical protein